MVQCVMTPGMTKMPLWSVDNWDFPPMVSIPLSSLAMSSVQPASAFCIHSPNTCIKLHGTTCTHAHTHIGAIPVTSGIFSDTSQSPTVSHFQCNGSEADLLSCSYSISVDNSSCSLPDDAGVVCQGSALSACFGGNLPSTN